MLPRQRIVRIDRVIESDGGPVCGCVARCAGGGEGSRDVIWVGGFAEVVRVASIASGGQGFEVVIGVALQARDRCMGPGEREGRMVEGRSGPSAGGVAHGAICREPGGHVSGIGGPVEVRLVAGVAGGGRRAVVIAYMALRASYRGVLAGEGIVGIASVIE